MNKHEMPVVVIVDDNGGTSYEKRKLLEREGFRVLEASTGEEALTLAKVSLPDLLLLDVNLPDISGFEVCERLKTEQRTRSIKVLQTSGARISASDRLKSLEVGADAYLIEPAEEEELLGTVRALIKLAQHERDNRQLNERVIESETRYRFLIERMPAAIYTIDRDGRITFYNDQAAELWGRRPCIGDTETRFCGSYKLFLPDGTPLPHGKTPMVDAVQDGISFHGREVIIERPDGSRRHVIVHIDPLRDTKGHIIGAVNLFTDITERKQGEEQLRMSSEYLEQELETTQHLHKVSAAAMQNDDVAGIYDAILDAAVAIMRSKYASIQWLDDERGELLLLGHRGFESMAVDFWTWVRPNSQSTCGIALRTHERVIVPDVSQCQWMTGTEDQLTYLGTGIYAVQTTPLLSRDGRLLGMISTHWDTAHDPTASELRRFDILARMAADVLARHVAHEQLRESEARFRTMAEAVPSFLFETDAAGWNTWTSDGWYRFTGQTPEQVAGHGWAEALHPDDRAANIDRWLHCMQEGVPFEAQQRLRRTDGTYAWVIARALPVRDKQGMVRRWVGSVTDVDGIVHAQDALREGKERLEGLVASAMDAVITIDADQHIVLFNPAAERMFGCFAAEVLGSSIDRFIPKTLHAAHREHVEQFGKAGTTARRMGALGTVRGVRVNGEEFPIEASISQMEAGGKRLFTVILRDITERKQAEAALRQSEERWQLAVAGTTDGIWDWDIAGHTVFLSSRWKEMRGYREDEMGVDETEWSSRIHPDDYARVMTTIESYLKKDLSVFHCEYRTRCKDGRYLWIIDRGIAIWDEQGRALRMVGSETDITLRKHAEERLLESEERLRVLTTAMPQLVWACAGTGECIYQSPQWETITGQSAADSLKFGWAEMIHPEDRTRTAETWRTTAAQGTTYQTEYRLHMKDGTYRWYLARAEALRDTSGAVIQWIGTSTDIDEVKRTEAALRQSEERLRLAHQAAGIGAFDWNVQTGVNTWTPELETMYGLVPGAFGKTLQDWEELLHPDDRAMALQGVEEAFKTGATTLREFRIIRPDGSARWISGRWQVFKDESGRSVRLTGVNLDITERKQTEAQIRQGQERLRLATEVAAVGIWEWNVKTNQIRWDAQMFKIYQVARTADSLVTYNIWSDAVVPDDLPEQERVLWETVRSRGSSSRTFRIHRYGDGEERTIEAVETVRKDARGETEWVIGTNIDITERKQAEEALRLSEQRLQRVLETDAVGVLFFDQSGTMIQANEVFLCLTGYRREQIERRELTWRTMTPPEWVEASETQLEQFARTGRIGPYEKEYLCADGSRRWMLFAGRDLGDGTIGEYAVDIQDRKQAEEALRESEARFRELVERSPFGIYVVDSHFRIAHMNESGQQGAFCNVRPVIGRDFAEAMHILWPDPVAEDIIRIFRHTLHTGEPHHSRDFVHLRADVKQTEGYEWELHRVTMPDGQPGVICYYFDSTKLRETEQALREAQQRLQRWNTELEQAVNLKTAELQHSHERLRAMASELTLAEQRERKRLATELHDHLQQMLVLGKLEIGRGKRFAAGSPDCESVLKRVDTILSDALTYSRTLVAELSPPVLHEFGLSAGLRWLGEYMKKHGLTVTVSVPDEPDERVPESHTLLLFQSVRELLINASKHAGTGTATVQLIQSDDQVQIEVRDDGHGFDLAAAAAAAAGTPTGGISSKFGLLSIQERMRALGGGFDIQSAPGQGTTARLTLPLEEGREEKGATLRESSLGARISGPNDASRDTRPASRIRVLLVDDHAMVRQGLRAVLEGYADIELVGEAANGEEALRLTDRRRPAAVVMDISMPGMNGIEATEEITKRYPETVVIGLSVNAEGENQEAMKRAGAVLLMTKEAAVEELHDAILNAVSTSTSRDSFGL